MRTGFGKLKQKQKFSLDGENDVVVLFGKYTRYSFKAIGEEDPDYLQWLLDTHEDKISPEVKRRLVFWLSKSANFWI